MGALLGSKLWHDFTALESPVFKEKLTLLVRELSDRGKSKGLPLPPPPPPPPVPSQPTQSLTAPPPLTDEEGAKENKQ